MRDLLECRLVVRHWERRIGPESLKLAQLHTNHLLKDKCSRLFQTSIQIHGRQEGLEGVHLEGGFVAATTHFFAAAQAQILSNLQFFGREYQVFLTDKVSAQLG